MYFRQNNLSEHLNDILKLRKQCVWGKQIMEYGLSYKGLYFASLKKLLDFVIYMKKKKKQD